MNLVHSAVTRLLEACVQTKNLGYLCAVACLGIFNEGGDTCYKFLSKNTLKLIMANTKIAIQVYIHAY